MKELNYRDFDDGRGHTCWVRHMGNIGDGEEFWIGGGGYTDRFFIDERASVHDFTEQELRQLLGVFGPANRPPR